MHSISTNAEMEVTLDNLTKDPNQSIAGNDIVFIEPKYVVMDVCNIASVDVSMSPEEGTRRRDVTTPINITDYDVY